MFDAIMPGSEGANRSEAFGVLFAVSVKCNHAAGMAALVDGKHQRQTLSFGIEIAGQCSQFADEPTQIALHTYSNYGRTFIPRNSRSMSRTAIVSISRAPRPARSSASLRFVTS